MLLFQSENLKTHQQMLTRFFLKLKEEETHAKGLRRKEISMKSFFIIVASRTMWIRYLMTNFRNEEPSTPPRVLPWVSLSHAERFHFDLIFLPVY